MDKFDDSQSAIAVNWIRSLYNTLERYRRTSMAAHGRLLPAVHHYAKSVNVIASQIAENNPGDPEVARWIRKLQEMTEQHGLFDDQSTD